MIRNDNSTHNCMTFKICNSWDWYTWSWYNYNLQYMVCFISNALWCHTHEAQPLMLEFRIIALYWTSASSQCTGFDSAQSKYVWRYFLHICLQKLNPWSGLKCTFVVSEKLNCQTLLSEHAFATWTQLSWLILLFENQQITTVKNVKNLFCKKTNAAIKWPKNMSMNVGNFSFFFQTP